MKIKQFAFTLCLLFFILVNFIYSQNYSKEKAKSIEIKANLMVLAPDFKFDDSVKLEDLKIFENGIEQKIIYLKKREYGLNVGLVFDNTGSIRKNLKEIIESGKIIINNLNPQDEAFIVRFVGSDKIEVTQEWTSDKSALNSAMDSLFIEGGQSAVLDAIYLSAGKILEREKKDKSKRYAMILFSDLEDRDSYYKFADVLKLFKESELQIFLLSYAENAPKEKQKAKALTNLIPFDIGGRAYSLPKKHTNDELLATLKSLLIELNSNYIVGYTSTNQKRDDQQRKLEVQIADTAKGEKRQAIIREDFIVPKD